MKKDKLYYVIPHDNEQGIHGPFASEDEAKKFVQSKWNIYFDYDYPPRIVKVVAALDVPPTKLNWVKK